MTWGVVFTLFLVAAEVVLRLRGAQPWVERKDVNIKVAPGGRFFTTHPSLGYIHLPGTFQVTLRDQYTFDVTHAPDTLRVTRPLEEYPVRPGLGEIWVFGGSFTHGWALSDEETYAWLLQERLPGYEVINFGVGGYGTTHSLIQFQERIARGERPEVAVVAYAGFHDERNVFSRSRRKVVAPWNKLGQMAQPSARLDSSGRLSRKMAEVSYTPLPLMEESALIHFLERRLNDLEARLLRGSEVTRAILSEFSVLAERNDITMVLVGISHSQETIDILEWARARKIAAVDISVDSNQEGLRHQHDPHPSALANLRYVEKLEPFLREVLRKQPQL